MKTILITGGTSGIGLDIAKYFYKKNFNISIVGMGKTTLINQIKKKFDKKKFLVQSLDLTKSKNVKKFVEQTKKKI